MTYHRITLIAAAFAVVLVARPVLADDAVSSEEASYDHAPVTLWLVPNIGVGGLSSRRLRTNFALALGASAYARLDGADIGVGASWITEEMRGAQISVGLNHVGADATGVQVAAGFNYVGGDLSGLQLASGVNYGRTVEGAQIGIINVGGQVGGAQIGIINVAGGVKGAQIGVINVAEDSSAPIGVVNAVKNGLHHVELWSSEAAPVNVSVKLGGRQLYTVLAVGVESSNDKQRWMTGLGIGVHLPIAERLYLEHELITWHVNEGWSFTDELNSLTSLRLIGGYRLNGTMSVFAGPTLNLLATQVGHGEGFGLIHGARLTSEDSDTTVRLWPGFTAGFQI
jgi:hypothetical protein